MESGRTSLPQKAEIPSELYQLMGFRAFGPQAIRVDILERFADLIRPALSWRPEHEGEKPEGAEDRGFRATPSMMSLLGCTEENLRTVLSALGYQKSGRPLTAEEAAAWEERIAARKAKNPEDEMQVPEKIETWHVPRRKVEGQEQKARSHAGQQQRPLRNHAGKKGGKPQFARKKDNEFAPAKPKREKPVDQNSPFAALAQLKSQMSSAKE